jgi:hypothetical protein
MLITNDFGRSLVARNGFYVSPTDKLYNFQTYAQIDSISPKIGSNYGGDILITGKYFYNDRSLPAQIEIGGQPCKIIDFNMENLPNTSFRCSNLAQENTKSNEYYGNRGINLIRENIFTSYESLGTVVPSVNSKKMILNQASYIDTDKVDVTIWLQGYFNPKKDSIYEFSLDTNAIEWQIYLSNDTKSENKVLIASSKTNLMNSLYLEANKK